MGPGGKWWTLFAIAVVFLLAGLAIVADPESGGIGAAGIACGLYLLGELRSKCRCHGDLEVAD